MKRPTSLAADFALAGLALLIVPGAAQARAPGAGGKLVLTNGISSIEGSSGGGLTPWAVIAGNETRDGIGAQASATAVELKDYGFRSVAIAIGAFDRAELSYSRQHFNTRRIGGQLGLGNDYGFNQDVFGAKVKLAGDLVYGPEALPAIAIGVQYRHNRNGAVVRAIGARHDRGTDFYVSATKLYLRHSLLLNVTARLTKANQLGLLGYGGDRSDRRSLQLEGSAAYQLSRRFAVGGEYRAKPNKLSIAREDDAFDVFAVYALNRHMNATVAYTDLGSIATANGQRGVLLQLQMGF